MLVLPRSTRAAHILRLHARALSTVAQGASSSPTADFEQSGDRPASDNPATTRQTPVANSGTECLFVHPWNGIRSSADGLAIAQALQDKYGPAKEVFFPRDLDSVNIFQPYFWLVFDDPNVRKRHPEAEAEADGQIVVNVADLPRSDGNIGVEEIMRGLGISTTEGEDPHHEPPPPTEAEPFKSVGDAPPDGYKKLDVRVQWSQSGPSELLRRKRPTVGLLPNEDRIPSFAAAWLAFDGFSPESARGPHTPNLFRAREKWLDLAIQASELPGDDDNNVATAAAESPSWSSQGAAEVEVETEMAAETREQKTPAREWVPITPSTPFAQRPRPTSIPPKENNASATTTAPVGPSPSTPLTADVADAIADDTTDPPTPTPKSGVEMTEETTPMGSKLSRRERILHLARKNARTPLPKLAEKPQPPPSPPPAEAEKPDEESEREGKERTIRERLWRLVGGNY